VYRGRFAPSPTGHLHAGSLLAALASWLRARQAGGQWLLRVEDIDPPREIAGSARAIAADLGRLGLESDVPVSYQSTRRAAYARALKTLHEAGHAFPCWCSRADLAASGGVHRDGHCVRAASHAREPAWRVRVPDTSITFEDGLQGPQTQNLRATVGDFVLRRADGLWAYQLACVVDDAAQGITEVVRGCDLLDSTPRQIHLQRLLGLATPRYLHVPLLTDARGRKLSKSAGDADIRGTPAAAVLRSAMAALAIPGPGAHVRAVAELLDYAIAHFDVARLAECTAIVWHRP
jgi:glutamyl-Q tRNA(Asp) synthetase